MRRVRRVTVIRENPHSKSLSRRGSGLGQARGRGKWRPTVKRVVAADTGPPLLPGLWRKSKDQGGYQVKSDISDTQAEAVGDREVQRRANPAVPSAS
jgi:hypothetical protein